MHITLDNLNKSLWSAFTNLIWSFFRDLFIVILTLNIIINFIISPYVFDNKYSYENITLKSAIPVDEEEIMPVLMDSYNKIRLSTLYDSNTDYIVHLSNSTRSDLLYFKLIGTLSNIKDLLLPFNNYNDYNTDITIPRMAGYVWAADIFGLSYVDYPDTHVVAHELTHQIIQKNINNALLNIVSYLKDRDIHEGYANLIAFGKDFEYYSPDFYSNASAQSGNLSRELHSDGKYYRHDYHSVTFDNNKYFDPYSYSNAFIIQQLLGNQTILELLSSLDSRDQIKSAKYNYFESRGYEKQDNIGSLKGTWIRDKVTLYE